LPLNPIHRLEVGDPNFDPPPHVVDAAIRSLQAGGSGHYSATTGTPEVRAAVRQYFNASRGIDCALDNCLVTPGGKPVIFATLLTLCEAGDEVVYPDPGFPAYRTTIEYVGAVPVPLPLEEATGFRFSPERLRALVNGRTKLIILNSPQNPTGGVLHREDLEAVAALCREHGCYVLSDEVYCKLLHDDDEPYLSIASLPGMLERTIILDSLSKTFAMCGWRAGLACFPTALTPHILTVAINSWTCLPKFIMDGMAAALTGSFEATDAMRRAYRERRDYAVAALNALPGVRCIPPKGALYAFPNITGTGLTSKEFAELMLTEAQVSVLPGDCFGPGGSGFIRISFATSLDTLHAAMAAVARVGIKF